MIESREEQQTSEATSKNDAQEDGLFKRDNLN